VASKPIPASGNIKCIIISCIINLIFEHQPATASESMFSTTSFKKKLTDLK
jgi:hypothetical protein